MSYYKCMYSSQEAIDNHESSGNSKDVRMLPRHYVIKISVFVFVCLVCSILSVTILQRNTNGFIRRKKELFRYEFDNTMDSLSIFSANPTESLSKIIPNLTEQMAVNNTIITTVFQNVQTTNEIPNNTSILVTNETVHSHDNKEEFKVNLSKEETKDTQSLPFDVNRVLQQNQTRHIGHMDYFIRDTPLPAITMENPALVVIGCSRLDAILKTLQEVSNLPGIHQYSIYLSLGCLESINKTTILSSVTKITHPNLTHLTILEYYDNSTVSKDIKKQYLRIHKHYLFIFQQLFEIFHHSHVFCVEDDLTLASTSLQFIQQLIPLLETDPSLICLSLFNDNALAEDSDPMILHRSSLFPNLAILFNRHGYEAVWKGEQISYSTNGWDHWLRAKAVKLGYECVYPSLPRVFHHLYDIGTTTNRRKNRQIGRYPIYNEPLDIDLGDLSYLLPSYYDLSLLYAIVPVEFIPTIYENMQISLNDIIEGKVSFNTTRNHQFSWSTYKQENHEELKVLGYLNDRKIETTVNKGVYKQVNIVVAKEYFLSYALRLVLARSPRGFHKGILYFEKKKTRIFLIDRREAWYCLPEEDALFFISDSTVLTSGLDETCNEVCSKYSLSQGKQYICNQNQLQFINSCYYLEKHFPCENGCWNEVGQDLPAYVNAQGNSNHFCLFSMEVQPLCDYALQNTQRLCLCTNRDKLAKNRNEIRTLVLKESRLVIKERSKRIKKYKCFF